MSINLTNTNLNSEEENLFRNLTNANAKTSQIKIILNIRFQEQFTTQRLENIIKGMTEADDGDNSLSEYSEKVEDEGGEVHWSNDSSGQVNTMFLATSKMLSAMRPSNPLLIQVDTLFDIDKARYKIAEFCYLNPPTNKTEICGAALLADESAKTLDFIFEKFSEICVHRQLSEICVHRQLSEICVHRQLSEICVHRQLSEICVHRQLISSIVRNMCTSSIVRNMCTSSIVRNMCTSPIDIYGS